MFCSDNGTRHRAGIEKSTIAKTRASLAPVHGMVPRRFRSRIGTVEHRSIDVSSAFATSIMEPVDVIVRIQV
ncbi:hypothetical protein Mal33_50640 [Rosistilla oblonga]|uniref:Uncharacterized protein n=1 Tax=Rosistilla oblonga TaxID=2527990 RepID=A0A518J124_9BACT|nr:hypothetical protein Mal33_50640 [Rosistilla oblonga]